MFLEWITELCSNLKTNLKKELLNNLKSNPEVLSMDAVLRARKRNWVLLLPWREGHSRARTASERRMGACQLLRVAFSLRKCEMIGKISCHHCGMWGRGESHSPAEDLSLSWTKGRKPSETLCSKDENNGEHTFAQRAVSRKNAHALVFTGFAVTASRPIRGKCLNVQGTL